jgi:Zn-dependent protease
MPGNARDEAEVGIAGPIAGALASLICLFIALANPSMPGFPNIWASLAYFGFFLNLFNLIPIIPFDGGRVLAAIDRRIWFIGFIGLLAIWLWQWWATKSFSIWLLIFVILAATQLLTRGRTPATPEARAYYAQTRGERIIIGLAYFALIAFLILGMTAAHSMMLPL